MLCKQCTAATAQPTGGDIRQGCPAAGVQVDTPPAGRAAAEESTPDSLAPADHGPEDGAVDVARLQVLCNTELSQCITEL